LFFFGLLLINPSLFSQVNRDEMENLGPVEFINYEGPYTRIDTWAQIRDIGYSLGILIRDGQVRAGATNRYFVIHSVSPADGLKLDADIFGLGVDVGVDHIRNLRMIIQGYLEGAYSYSARDAAILAEYITVYNAVYRGDLNFFSARYKNPVMENLTRERVGLSIRFDEWPGQTLMLIPLGMVSAGPLSSIDTSALIDSRVLEQFREEADMRLDTRRDMVDLLERQAEEAALQAETQREAIRQEQTALAQEREEIQQLLRQDPELLAELTVRQQEMEERQQELEQLMREAQLAEEYAEQKADEAQEERRRIAEDQQSRIGQVSPPEPIGVLGGAILNSNSSLGRLVLLDSETGQELRRSGINTVNVRSITQVNGRVIAIAGEARGNGAIRLVEFDTKTLEMINQGDEDISPQSLIWVNGTELYVIISAENNNFLACFDTDLVLQARSSIPIHPLATVTFNGSYIVTQRADGSAALVKPGNLIESL
jgi:hypothetical protein